MGPPVVRRRPRRDRAAVQRGNPALIRLDLHLLFCQVQQQRLQSKHELNVVLPQIAARAKNIRARLLQRAAEEGFDLSTGGAVYSSSGVKVVDQPQLLQPLTLFEKSAVKVSNHEKTRNIRKFIVS